MATTSDPSLPSSATINEVKMSIPRHNVLPLSSISKPRTRYRPHGADLTLDTRVRKHNTDDAQDPAEHEIARDVDPPREETSASSCPPFRPFFALVEDANSSEYYHPTVHYIF